MNIKAEIERAGIPAHERVYRQIKSMILFGELAPGQAVTIQGLVEELSAGMTPVREAIRRLTAAGALETLGNRRISVPVLDKSTLEQLSLLRLAVEPELAARSATLISQENIGKMKELDAELDASIAKGDVQGYLEKNYAFHQVLNTAAHAPVLSGVVERSWLMFGPSLRVVCGKVGTMSVTDQHKELLDALASRDIQAARDALVGDVRQGMDLLAQTL